MASALGKGKLATTRQRIGLEMNDIIEGIFEGHQMGLGVDVTLPRKMEAIHRFVREGGSRSSALRHSCSISAVPRKGISRTELFQMRAA